MSEIIYSPEFEEWFSGWLTRHQEELVDFHKRAMWDAWQTQSKHTCSVCKKEINTNIHDRCAATL